jgi:LysR family nitrogen assimilation transcriptional regulator
MEIRELNALLAVADAGTVTRAARLLHLEQPAVSRQIRLLETELGLALFERSRNGMVLTEAGEVLVGYARRAVAELEKAGAQLRADATGIRGIVTVGILDSVTDLVAEPLVTAVRRVHPDIELRLFTAFAGHLRRWLYDGELDMALLFGVTDPTALQILPVASEQLWAVAPKTARLRADQPLGFVEIARRPLVVPVRGNALRTLVDEAAARAGVDITISVETNATRVQKKLVAAGHGWAILPAVCVVDELTSDTFSIAPLADEAALRELVLATPRTSRSSRATQAVAGFLLKILHQTVLDGRWPSVIWHLHDEAGTRTPVAGGSPTVRPH